MTPWSRRLEGMIDRPNAQLPTGRSLCDGWSAGSHGGRRRRAPRESALVQPDHLAAYDSQRWSGHRAALRRGRRLSSSPMAKKMQEETGYHGRGRAAGPALSLRTLKTDLGLTNDQITKLVATVWRPRRVTPGMESVSQASKVTWAGLRGQTQECRGTRHQPE